MKAQMKFQKILSLATLIVAAIVFVYAICFFSGNFSHILIYGSLRTDYGFSGADVFIDAGQSFVDILLVVSIVFIAVVAFSYIMGNSSRRNYYITNYISIGILIAVAGCVALFGIIYLAVLMNAFYNKVDWEGMEVFRQVYASFDPKFGTSVSKSPAIFIIGLIIFLVVLVSALAWAYNLIWKIKLMKGEKALIEQGLVKEVA